MSESKEKFMIVGGESGAMGRIQEILVQHYDVTMVDTAEEASEKAQNEEFDLIVTGYILPRMSGASGIPEIKTAQDIAVEEKEKVINKVRDAVKQLETDFQTKHKDAEKLLKESQAKYDSLVDMLDKRMRQLVSENTKLGQQVQSMEERLATAEKEKSEAQEEMESLVSEKAEVEKMAETAMKELEDARNKTKVVLDEKAEMEKKLAEAGDSREAFNREIAGLKEELAKTSAIAETAVREKAQFQEKLVQFQENWEKYIAGK